MTSPHGVLESMFSDSIQMSFAGDELFLLCYSSVYDRLLDIIHYKFGSHNVTFFPNEIVLLSTRL